MDKIREEFEKYYASYPKDEFHEAPEWMWIGWQAAAALYREAGRVEGREQAAKIVLASPTAQIAADAIRDLAAVRKEGA